jgi:hypothetical protein
LRALALLNPKTPFSPPRRIGAVIDTIIAVLEIADQPMRARDIRTTAEQLLGRPIKWTSVKATLAEHACGSRPRFQRTGYGRYRIASTRAPAGSTVEEPQSLDARLVARTSR